MTRKIATIDAPKLPGEWEERQYEPTRKSHELRLPRQQERFVHPDPPGKRDDGKLWFDGPGKSKTVSEQAERKEAERIYVKKYYDPDRLKPRDFRKGDRWLPWHFGGETK